MKGDKKVVRSLTLITQFGINMLVPILLCMFLGIFLDKLFSTSFIAIVLFFIGALAGFTNVFRLARNIYSESDDEHINYYKINSSGETENDEESASGEQDA